MASDWLALIIALPTSPSAVRVRVWRAMKASGCGALRDGVYLLPDRPDCTRLFDGLADEVRQAAGEATLLQFASRDAEQQTQFEELFDRSAEYRDFEKDLAQQRRELRSAAEVAGRRALRALAQRLGALRGIDFFGDERGANVATALEDLRMECEARWSPGEPAAQVKGRIEPLDPADYQGRTWATRRRPWARRSTHGRRLADPSLHRPIGPLRLAEAVRQAAEGGPGFRLRWRNLQSRRRQGHVRSDRRQFRARR
jgi:hypothetical protein